MRHEDKPRLPGELETRAGSGPPRLAEVERLFAEATREWHALAEALGALRESLSPPDFRLALSRLELPEIDVIERRWREGKRAHAAEEAARQTSSKTTRPPSEQPAATESVAADPPAPPAAEAEPAAADDEGDATPKAEASQASTRGASTSKARGKRTRKRRRSRRAEKRSAACAERRAKKAAEKAAKNSVQRNGLQNAAADQRQAAETTIAKHEAPPVETIAQAADEPAAPIVSESRPEQDSTPATPDRPGADVATPVDGGGDDQIQDRMKELVTLLREQLGHSSGGPATVPRELTLAIAREVAGRVRESVLEAIDARPSSGGDARENQPRKTTRIPLDDVAAMIDHVTGSGGTNP